MNKYNGEYYIACPVAGEDENVLLKPDNKTSKSGYRTQVLSPGRPLFFTNAYPMYIPKGKTERITDVMFNGAYMVVNENIKEYLSGFNINSLQIYPAVYVDLNNKLHENIWFLNFYETLDCWDREESSYDDDSKLLPPSIDKFSLDQDVLDEIPEENRLMFVMGGLDDKYVFIHEKVVNFLQEIHASGIRLIPVVEYEDGMEQVPA
jgi:hypothetical protein